MALLMLSAAGKLMMRNGKLFVDTNGKDCCCGPSECCDLIADQIKATIINVTDPNCSCGVGNFYTLTREVGTNKWRGGGTFCDREIEITFCCGQPIEPGDPQCIYGFFLGVTWDPSCISDVGECDDGGHIPADEQSCECDPLFASFSLGFSGLCCGEDDSAEGILIEITDI